MEYIASRTNSLIVRMAKLSEKKYRDAEGLFVIEGIKLFDEMLKAGILPVYAFAAERAAERLSLLPDSVKKYRVSDSVYEKISNEKAPQGIFCAIKYLDNQHKSDTIYGGNFSGPLLALSSVQDPGNLGTIARSARAFGASALLLSDDSADVYSPKALRASMGALFVLPTLRTPDLAASLTALSADGYDTYAAALNESASPPQSLSLGEKTCFVLGNEGHGLSDTVLNACRGRIFIPMTNGCESLNVSAAAAVLMWEYYRTKSGPFPRR